MLHRDYEGVSSNEITSLVTVGREWYVYVLLYFIPNIPTFCELRRCMICLYIYFTIIYLMVNGVEMIGINTNFTCKAEVEMYLKVWLRSGDDYAR